jgi:hypothetical protein
MQEALQVLEARLPRDVIRIIKKFVGPKVSPSPPASPASPYMSDRAKQVQKIRNSPKLTAMAFYYLPEEDYDDDDIEI